MIIATLVTVLLSFPAPGPTAIDAAVADLVAAIPGLFGWFWELSYDLVLAWAVILILATLLAHGRMRLLAGELLAACAAVVLAAGAGIVSGTDLSDSLGSFAVSAPPPVYPSMRIAVAVAVIVTASPHLSRPLRYIGRWVVAIGVIATVALGVASPLGVVVAISIGVGAGSLVHLILGSPGGRLSLGQIAAALGDLGVEVTEVRNVPLQPSGVAMATASTSGGRSVLVKVYGRDAWDGQLLASVWSTLWNRGESARVGGRLRQVEHEAFVTLFAAREGVAVLPVVAAGMAEGRDALLVIDTVGSSPLEPSSPAPSSSGVEERLVLDLWAQVQRLHAIGIAHGSLDVERIALTPEGTVVLADFSHAVVAASDPVLFAERAQVLVMTALLVGPHRAVALAADALGVDRVAASLPYLQPAALDRTTRHAVRAASWSVDDLRGMAAAAAGVEEPELEQLRRVTIGSVATVAIIALVAYTLISAVSNVGLATLVAEFRKADLAWIVLALLMSPVVGVGQGFAAVGACIRPVRLGPVILLQYGIQFIALALPSSAARIALEIRFFQRVGLSATGSVAVGVIDSVCGFIVQVLLILAVTLSGLASLDLPSKGSSRSLDGTLIVVGVVVLVLLAAAALAVPRARSFLREKTVGVGESLRVLRSPTKVTMIFSGNLAAQLLLTVILGLCLRAFGQQLSFAELILVNMLVILFAGFMPVPGGMGVAEAGYTAGLVALGVPHAAAMSTAIAYRLATYYLPPIWGGISMKWLRSHSYI